MLLTKKRIRSIDPLRPLIKKGATFSPGIKNLGRFSDVIERIGFSIPLESGASILPSVSFGPVSLYNAEGKYLIHKDRKKETAYRMAEWHWVEWHGPDRVEQSKLVDVPYKRYPRTFLQPPAVELTLYAMTAGDLVLVGPNFKFEDANEQHIVHVVNLFLEIFGECQFFTENLEEIIRVPIKRLNWRILPPGQMPWSKLKTELRPVIKNASKGNRPLIEHRMEMINRFNPDFVAVGQGGFRGYVVLGFTKKNIYTLESLYYGNATYIFGEKWEDLSKRTKAEILNNDLQTDRIIHREGWDGKIDKWLRK